MFEITYFASFFNNNSFEKEAQNVDIKIPTTLESMKLVIRFLYTGRMECDSLSLKDILDLLRLLELMEEKELFADIENFLIKKLQNGESTLEKVLLSANVCENSKFKKISNENLYLICENIEDIESLPEVKYLSSTFLEMLINDERWVNFDEDDEESNRSEEKDSEYELLIHHQIEVFTMFVNWLSGNPDCDSDFKARILNIFELDRFTSDELSTSVRNSSLYSDKDHFEALAQKNVFLKNKHETLEKSVTDINNRFEDLKKLFENIKENLNDTNSKIEREKSDYAKKQVYAFVDFYFSRNRKYEWTYNKRYDKVSCSLDILEETAKEIINQ